MVEDNNCPNCGHLISDHELNIDGSGRCECTIEEGKAIFQCICEGGFE